MEKEENTILYEGKKPHSLRLNNYRLLLYLLRDKQSSTIGEIASELKLSKTTIAKILQNLKEKGLIIFEGKGSSTDEGGKRPDLYAINKNYKYCLVFRYPNERTLRCKVYDLGISVIYSVECELKERPEYEDVLDGMVGIYQKILKECKITEKDLYGIVLCADGIVDSVEGVLCNPITYYYWEHNKPFRRDFVERAGIKTVPIYIDNICRYAGYAEMMCKENRKYGSMAMIHNVVETAGIGGCIIRDHKMQHGSRSCVGEFGHLVVDRTVTEVCRCGNRGCFEQVMSAPALLQKAAKRYIEHPESKLYESARQGLLTMDTVLEYADEGETIACQLLEETADVYAWIICNIMIMDSPEVIVLQGLFTQKGKYFFRRLREKLAENPFFQGEKAVPVKKTECPWDTLEGFELGAAQYARDQFFDQDKLYE